MLKKSARWVLFSIVLLLMGCSKKQTEPKFQPVSLTLELPEQALGYLVFPQPQGLLSQVEKVARLVAPVAPNTLYAFVNSWMMQLGLNDPTVVDLAKPMGILVLDPHTGTIPLVLGISTKGRDLFLKSLKPIWSHTETKEGSLQISSDKLDRYAMAFLGLKEDVQPKAYLKFQDDFLLLATEDLLLENYGKALASIVRHPSHQTHVTMRWEFGPLRKAFNLSEKIVTMFEGIKLNTAQMPKTDDMPSSEQLHKGLDWSANIAKSLIEGIRTLSFEFDLKNELLEFTQKVTPEPGSGLANFMQAQKRKALQLDRALPEDVFLAVAGNLQWSPWKKELLQFGKEWVGLVFKNISFEQGDGKEWLTLMEEMLDVMGDEFAVAEDLGRDGLRLVQLMEITDEAKWHKLMDKAFSITKKIFNETKIENMRFDLNGPNALEPYRDVALTAWDIVWDLKDMNPYQAKMLKQMYGDKMTLVSAVMDKKLIMSMGQKAVEDIKQCLDRLLDHKPGLLQSKAFFDASGEGHQNAGGYVFLSLSRIIQNTLGFASPQLVKSDSAQTNTSLSSFSGLFLSIRSEKGEWITSLRLPNAHVREVGQAIKSMMQQAIP